jgi:uncharacterized protein YbjT (DUF2867 family)
MILVAGGSGRLGSLVVAALRGRGQAVRVLTRDPARARHLAASHVEIACGDVRDAGSVRAAAHGASTIISCVHGFVGRGGTSPASVDRDGNINLIETAEHEHADLVLVSVLGASPHSPMELMRMTHAAEQHLRASGVPATVVQPAAFLETWIDILRQTARRSGRPVVFGRGENPINFVSVTDVATLVTHTAIDASTRGRTLPISGPQNLTFNQLAHAIQRAAGRTQPPRHVPRPALRILAATAGRAKPQLRRQLVAALVMDSAPLATDSADNRSALVGIPVTSLQAVLEAEGRGRPAHAGDAVA